MSILFRKKKILLIILSICLILPQFVTNNNSTAVKLSAASEPEGIRLSVVNDPRNSIMVSWFSEEQASDPKVAYSTSSSLSDGKEVKPTEKIVDGTYLYSAELNDLKENKKYYYQVSSSKDQKSDILNFKTAPDHDVDHIEFLVLGDTQKVEEVTMNMTSKALEKYGSEVDFVIHMGDIVDVGQDQSWYNDYFSEMELLHNYKQTFFTEGNHENGYFTKMYDNIPLPSNGMDSRYYSFRWGPAGFLSLNDNDAEIFPHQKVSPLWLESELNTFDADKYIVWKFAYFHQPIFNAKYSREDKAALIPTWAAAFDSHDVDIVFQGHNHYYQRTYPLNSQREIDKSEKTSYHDPDAPIYITCNSDRKLYDVSDGYEEYELPDYVLYHNQTTQISYVEIIINETSQISTLNMESWATCLNDDGSFALEQNLTLIDQFNITKDLPKKYLDADYETSSTFTYQRLPEFVYYLLYVALLSLILVIVNKNPLKRYFQYKIPKLKEKNKRSKDINSDKAKTGESRKKMTLSYILYIILALGLSLILIVLDLLDTVYVIIISLGVSILFMVPINRYLIDKQHAIFTLTMFLIYIALTGFLALYILAMSVFYYLYYLNFILLGIGGILTYTANYLSKNVEVSRISGEKSYYLGGTCLFFGTAFLFYGIMNFIALI